MRGCLHGRWQQLAQQRCGRGTSLGLVVEAVVVHAVGVHAVVAEAAVPVVAASARRAGDANGVDGVAVPAGRAKVRAALALRAATGAKDRAHKTIAATTFFSFSCEMFSFCNFETGPQFQ